MTVDNLYIEKQKAEKSDKGKKPNKGKGKAKLKVEGDTVSNYSVPLTKIYLHQFGEPVLYGLLTTSKCGFYPGLDLITQGP